MKHLSKKIDVYGLKADEIQQLRKIAKEHYGKASVSLLAKKLLQEHIRLPEKPASSHDIGNIHQKNMMSKNRLSLRLPPKHHAYLSQKAQLQHSSLNDIVRDIIAEYIEAHPVLSNDAVQALYQSNYQLLRLGRNINQLAHHFNAATPQSITTQTLNTIIDFLTQHQCSGASPAKTKQTIEIPPHQGNI